MKPRGKSPKDPTFFKFEPEKIAGAQPIAPNLPPTRPQPGALDTASRLFNDILKKIQIKMGSKNFPIDSKQMLKIEMELMKPGLTYEKIAALINLPKLQKDLEDKGIKITDYGFSENAFSQEQEFLNEQIKKYEAKASPSQGPPRSLIIDDPDPSGFMVTKKFEPPTEEIIALRNRVSAKVSSNSEDENSNKVCKELDYQLGNANTLEEIQEALDHAIGNCKKYGVTDKNFNDGINTQLNIISQKIESQPKPAP